MKKILLLAASLLALQANPAESSCMVPGRAEESLESASSVFAGRVIDIVEQENRPFTDDVIKVTFEVSDVWKGEDTEQIAVTTLGTSTAGCGFSFTEGEEYLVYAHGSDGELSTSLSSGTKLLSRAQADLRVLGSEEVPTDEDRDMNVSQAESPTPTSGATQSPVQRRVKVFFPVAAAQNPTVVRPVWRTTSSSGVAQFAIAQLLAGPTSSEKQQGLTAIPRPSGSSNCGQDFTITINDGVAELRFCRKMIHGGILDSARTTSAIDATLKQFSTVSSVRILDQNGNCLGDASGENICLGKGTNPEKLTPLSHFSQVIPWRNFSSLVELPL